MNTIYIASINRSISIKEFKSYLPKVGHVYKINNHNFHKCVGYKGYEPIIESLVILNNPNSDGRIQMSLNPDALPIPQLDFVNRILSGEYIEIESSIYECMVAALKISASSLEEMMEKA